MPISEAAHQLLDATDAHDVNVLTAILRDDFQMTVSAGGSYDKSAMLALQKAYFDAFSNWDYNFSEAEQSDNVMTVKYAPTGTHDGMLDLRALGYDIQAEPTGKSISLPISSVAVTFDEYGKVMAMNMQQAEGASLLDVLAQLGIDPPSVG